MKKKKLRIGAMGTARGYIALKCEPFLSDEMEVVAYWEPNPKYRELFKEKPNYHEGVKIYSDFEEFISCGLDAVLIFNAFHEHHNYAMRAMELGIAVLSETTAAPSYGDCVALIECAERTGAKYMLGANCVYLRSIYAMRRLIQEKKYGNPVYADTEYVHLSDESEAPFVPGAVGKLDKDNLHWRHTLPRCYYNMHDLGPMMFILDSFPKKVVGKAVVTEDKPTHSFANYLKSYALVEMENGMVVNYSGHTSAGANGKWYRIGCSNGTIESVRYNKDGDKILEGSYDNVSTTELDWVSAGVLSEEDTVRFFTSEEAKAFHGGRDLILLQEFLRYVRGEIEPPFDIYKSVALSATAITAWYSMLSGSVELEVPDFRKKEDRDKHRNDFRSPFAKRLDDLTLPCTIDENRKFHP